MRRILSILALVVSILALTATTALAAPTGNPHFIGDPSLTVSGNTLTVSFKAAGLGSVQTAHFELSGSVDVFSRCYNRGGNKPQADNKQETIAVSAANDFGVRNGSVSGSFSITPLSTLTCPGNQRVVIESVTYDLTLTGPSGLTASFSS